MDNGTNSIAKIGECWKEGRHADALEVAWGLGAAGRGQSIETIACLALPDLVIKGCRQAIEVHDFERFERLIRSEPSEALLVFNRSDYLDRTPQSQIYRRNILLACVRAAHAIARYQQAAPATTLGKLAAIATSLGFSTGFLWSLLQPLWPESLPVTTVSVQDRVTTHALLIRQEGQHKEGMVCVLALELLAGGSGELFRSADVALRFFDQEFLRAERNARQGIASVGLLDRPDGINHAKDIRYSLLPLNGETLPTRLTGNSLGAAIALAGAKLLGAKRPWTSIDLTGTAVSAAITPAARLEPIGGIPLKLVAAAHHKSFPRITRVGVCDQNLEDLAGKDGLVRHNDHTLLELGQEFRIVGAHTLSQLARRLSKPMSLSIKILALSIAFLALASGTVMLQRKPNTSTLAPVARRPPPSISMGDPDAPPIVCQRVWLGLKDGGGRTSERLASWHELLCRNEDVWLVGGVEEQNGTGMFIGSGAVLHSFDAGRTWEEIGLSNSDAGAGTLSCFLEKKWNGIGPIYSIAEFPDPQPDGRHITNVWIASVSGIFSSTNPGGPDTKWTRMTPSPDGPDCYSYFLGIAGLDNDREVYAYGWQGITHCERGSEWSVQLKTHQYCINSLRLLSTLHPIAWAVANGGAAEESSRGWPSDYGTVFHLDGPGSKWERVPLNGVELGPSQEINDIINLRNSNSLIVVGGHGLIARSSREGADRIWKSATLTKHNLMSIEYDHSSTLWVVGRQGTILRSPNDGDTWQECACYDQDGVRIRNDLCKIRFDNFHRGWIIGEDIVLKCEVPQ